MGVVDNALPVIVLGRGHTGLGTLRCLALAGIPAYIACPADDLAARSRFYRPLPGSAWNGDIGPNTADALRAVPLPEAIIIAAADDAALWLAHLPASDLGERFRTSSSSAFALETLQDKAKFGAFLARSDIAHPRTYTIRERADIEMIPFSELDRVFLKPVDSQRFSQTVGAKGVWADTRAQFEAAWSRFAAQDFQVIAQEYVPGASSEHYFVDGFRDRNGAMSGLFVRRRVRIYPPDFGNSSYCRSIPLTEVAPAVASLEALLAALQYRGIFSAEFKRDARDGVFRILEVNTRAWWYVEFAARCGVNVCEMAYRDAQEQPVAPARRAYRTGVGCVNLFADVKSALSQTPSWSGSMDVLLQWARAQFHVFRADDPGPFAWMFLKTLRHWTAAKAKKLRYAR